MQTLSNMFQCFFFFFFFFFLFVCLFCLYDFVVVCTFTNFKNRKTVARRHVVGSIIVRAPYGNPAMIVRPPHGFMIILGLK